MEEKKTFRVEVKNSGLVYGDYEAESPEQALDAMAVDAGYESMLEMHERLGYDEYDPATCAWSATEVSSWE